MTGRSYDGVVNPPRVVPVETPWPPVGAELSALPSLDVTPVPPAYWFSLPVSTELSSALAATVHGPVRELGSPRMKREWRRRPGGAGADASEARPGLDDRLTWGWSRYRETGHHDRPAGALVDRDGRAGALWPDGRAQEPAGEDHHALALSGPPDDGQACGAGSPTAAVPGRPSRIPGAFLTRGNRFYWFVTILAATAVAALIIARTLIMRGSPAALLP